ncbi:uncharacterized protein O8D03_006082 [Erethizon dorsatum]
MAENHQIKPPLKMLEYIGKEYITGVLEDMVQKNVLKLDEEAKKKFMEAKHGDKARVFVDSVQQKPKEAGQAFLQTFFNLDKETNDTKALQENKSGAVESPETTDTLKTCPPEEFQKVCTERAEEIYPIKDRNERTRQALIICNIEFDHLSVRKGAEHDVKGMKKLLEDLDYTVTVKENLTARDMESVLSEFAGKAEHKSSDSTFLVLMSHGILRGICGTTHSDQNPDVLQYDGIFNIFNNRTCPGLRDKPKVIIVQACRGGNPGGVWVKDSPAALEDSLEQSSADLESDAVYLTHVEKDFIVFYSTTPHNKSWRHSTKGSYFITQLLAGFQKYAWCDPLQEIFRKVQLSCEKPNDIAQMPTIGRSTVGRLFYLFPGHYKLEKTSLKYGIQKIKRSQSGGANLMVVMKEVPHTRTQQDKCHALGEDMPNMFKKLHGESVSTATTNTIKPVSVSVFRLLGFAGSSATWDKPLSSPAVYDQLLTGHRTLPTMEGKGPLDDESLNNIKSVVKNILDGIFDDVGKNVLNKEEIRKIKKDMKLIVNNAESLVEDIIDKTEKTGKLVADHFSHSKKQLRLTAENESKESRDEEIAVSAEALAISPPAPQEIHCTQSKDTMKLCPRDHFHKLKTEKADEIYPIMEKEGRTRLALIICNKKFDSLSNRHGAEVDLLRMQDLLKDLGYSVIVKENLTAQGMETELRQFADHQDHQSSDSTFLVFMSHGILDGICGTKHSDEEPDVLHDDTIFTIFNNNNCKNLRNKPKIIIMQACRGRGDGIVWVTTDRGEAMADTHACPLQYYRHYGRSDAVTMTHVEKDFIAFKSSTPHNVSWILDTAGSLFISQLTYFIKEYSWSHHLEEIFRMVQRSFETPTILTQMPTVERVSMTRYFYLFPGN